MNLDQTKETAQFPLDHVACPILTLPVEITSSIFVQCLPEALTLSPHPSRCPMLLMHICKLWRSIAIFTQRLWTSLQLDVSSHYFSDPETWINDWFGRAGQLPLSLNLRGHMEEDAGTGCLAAIIHRHAPQLQFLTLHVHLQDLIGIINVGRFSLLQKLEIGLPFHERGEEVYSIELFQETPVLREVVMVEEAIPSLFADRLWTQLTNFSCESISGDDALIFFCGAAHLVECSLSVEDEVYIDVSPSAYPTLESLSLVRNSCADLLKFLTFPNLENLYITDIGDIRNSYFIPFLSRSSASLRCFTFGAGPFTRDLLSVQWFSIMSRLTELELGDPGRAFFGEFFLMLDRDRHWQADFLPHLRTLTCVDCFWDINQVLLRALSSRSSGEARLQSFRQVYPTRSYMSPSNPELAALRALVSRGMDIHVGMAGVNLV